MFQSTVLDSSLISLNTCRCIKRAVTSDVFQLSDGNS